MPDNLINDSSFPINKKTALTFDWANRFESIVVTGCQRSGTSIAAKMIAHSLGRELVDEESYGTKDVNEWTSAVKKGLNVVHSPAMSRFVEDVANSKTLIVYMIRDKEDIQKSIERIGWSDWDERTKYYPDRNAHISDIKFNYWKTQKIEIPFWVELNYDALAQHELWIPKHERTNFAPRQTEK